MKNKALATLYFYNVVFVFAENLLGPLYAIFVEEINGGILMISGTWSIFLLSSVFFTFIVYGFGDSIKEQEYLLMGGFVVRSLAWFLFIFVNSITGLIIVQILLGLGAALGTPAFNAMFAKHLDCGHEIREFSNWKLINDLVVAASVMIGGLVVSYFGFKYLFFVMSLLALIAFIGVLIKPRKLL